MNEIHYIGLDVHKKSIQFCEKRADGSIVDQGRIAATRVALRQWAEARTRPWKGSLEATMFSAWIYDVLKPYAVELKVAHPAKLKAITAAKHSSDRLDAAALADLTRIGWIPGVWVAPPAIREQRIHLRFRNLVVRQSTQVKNRIASTLMEHGVEYNKGKLHQKKYFHQLMEELAEVPDSVRLLLQQNRGTLDLFQTTQQALLKHLTRDKRLAGRVEVLSSIPGIGVVTALTWALEIGDPARFSSAGRAMSYCGLVAGRQQSGETEYRRPLSKQRNAHLQTVLIEAAHLAPRYNPVLRALYDKVKQEVHVGAAVIAVARKLVAYLLAVDRSGQPFQMRPTAAKAPPPVAEAQSPPAGKAALPPAPPAAGPRLAQRSSPSRVRQAVRPRTPLTAAGRRANTPTATGGSGGKAARQTSAHTAAARMTSARKTPARQTTSRQT